jgi:lysophospholipase L1-like esterase
MTDYSRRQFLKHLGAASALFVAGRSGLLSFAFSDGAEPFELLVLGDSIASGQGLREEHRFYTLTKNWLETEIFAEQRKVNLKVKAHSGTTLNLHGEEAAAFAKAEIDVTDSLNPELNVSFPSVRAQIDIAAKEYKTEKISPESVNLIMLTGGINDITTAVILDPFGDEKKLRAEIAKYCRDSMREILEHAGSVFPNATIVLAGYYPLISTKTSSGKLFNAVMERFNFPRPLKPVANNLFTKQFFKLFQKKGAKRSQIWLEESNLRFGEAVDAFNSGTGTRRAIFVESPIDETNCFGTKDPLVFGMGKKGRIEDLYYDERSALCEETVPKLNASTRLDYPMNLCKMSGLAHPNVEGSRRYTEAIKENLKPFLTVRGAAFR